MKIDPNVLDQIRQLDVHADRGGRRTHNPAVMAIGPAASAATVQ
jgi:hypothetical protein